MVLVVYSITILINLLAMIRSKNSKLALGITLISITLIWVGNTQGPDIDNYLLNYNFSNNLLSNNLQIIYNGIIEIAHNANLTFYQYRAFITVIVLIALGAEYSLFAKNIHGIIIIYLCHLFFLDGIQIRNFIAMPFFILGMLFLIKHEKRWRIKYSICIVLASMCHVSFVAYLVLLCIPNGQYKRNKLIKMHGIAAVAVVLFVFTYKSRLIYFVQAMNLIDASRAESYSQVATNMGAMIPIVLQFLSILTTGYVFWRLSRIHYRYPDNTELISDLEKCKYIFWINLIGCYLLPFSMIQLTFYRLIRNILPINYLAIHYGRKYCKDSNLMIIIILYLGIWMFAEYSLLNSFDVIVTPFFSNNLYLG